MILSDWLKRFLASAKLPSPPMQAVNLIRFIGDHVSETGEPLPSWPKDLHAVIGAPSREFAGQLARELLANRRLQAIDSSSKTGFDMMEISLTLSGWDQYEAEKTGLVAGKYGFIAMKFNDENLDPFVEGVIKPSIKRLIGYDLYDMRNVARAGIIDNLMRAQIRDAAFVLVDLTHDNPGAYWEAGYAEGLGKPVIYICEQAKFEEAKTHFDTNHCTTVLWSASQGERFTEELVATLRRSLKLFPT